MKFTTNLISILWYSIIFYGTKMHYTRYIYTKHIDIDIYVIDLGGISCSIFSLVYELYVEILKSCNNFRLQYNLVGQIKI